MDNQRPMEKMIDGPNENNLDNSNEAQNKISELKQQINNIDQARTEGRLNEYFRWPNPAEAEQLATNKVQRLEDEIRKLESDSHIETVAKKEPEDNPLSEIEQRKQRIKQLEDAKKTGTLSLQYNFNPDHMQLADQEVVRLENEIRSLEKGGEQTVDEHEEEGIVSGEESKEDTESSEEESNSKENKPAEDKKEEVVVPTEKIKRRIGIVETDLVEQQARDMAEQRMNADKKELKGVKGFFKRIWKYNWANEYYRQKEIQKVKGEIKDNGSVYGEKDLDGKKSATTKEAILSRFLEENPELIHNLAGEELIEDQRKKAGAKIHLRNLIKDFALARHSEESFTEERNRIISHELGLNIKDSQSLAVSNELLEIAKNAKDALEHGESVDNLDLDFELIVGRAKSGARTEAELSNVDRLIEKIKGTSVGRFVNETTIAAAYALTIGTAQRAARGRAAAWLTFGGSAFVGGAIMAGTENMRLKRERAQMEREDASGQEFAPAEAKRRQEMSKFVVGKQNALDLSLLLNTSLYNLTPEGTRETKILSLEDYSSAVSALSDIESRIRMSDSLKIDLIRFSSVEDIETERTSLDIERAKAKVELRRMFDSHKNELGSNNFEEYLEKMIGVNELSLTNENSDYKTKQKLFQKFKRRKVGSAALKGVAIGLTVGTAVQEVGSLVQDEQEGLLERGIHKIFGSESTPRSHNFTALEALRQYFSGGMDRATEGANHYLYSFGPGEHFRLPEGVEVVSNSEGGFSLIDNHNADNPRILVNNIFYDEKGNITAESFKEMQESGVISTRESYSVQITETEKVTTEVAGQEITMSPQDYIKENGGAVSHITRDWTLDSASPNHLGIDDPKLDSNGNIVIKLNLTTNGSVMADGTRIDPLSAAADGKFRVFFTESSAGQSYPAEILADPNGQVLLTSDNPVYKMFKIDPETNKIIDSPLYIEAGVITGEAESGALKTVILATEEGTGEGMTGLTKITEGSTITDYVDKVVDKKVHITNFDLIERDNFDLPPIIPIWGRSPLERINQPEDSSQEGGAYYGKKEGYGLLSREQYEERLSTKLRDNKNLDLSGKDQEIISEYLEKQEPNYKNELETLVGAIPKMESSIETVITVPAYQEGENLEKTLLNYAKLNHRQKFEIAIFENHYLGVERDGTKEVIERVRKQFPDLNIVHLYKQFEQKPTIGAVRKYLVDAVLMRKHLSGVEHSVTLVSNDADLEDISVNYADDISRAFRENPKLDIVGGKWDYPEEAYEKFPLFHVSQRLWHYYDIVFRHNYLKSPELIGRNSAFRSGIYAGIGGYNDKAKLAEDLEIGWMAKKARDYQADRSAYLNRAWLVSNPRRTVGKMLSGEPIVNQYGDFHENEEIRKKTLEELLSRNIDFNESDLEKNIQALYEFYQRTKKSNGGWLEGDDESKVDEAFDRSMGWVGAKYHIENGKVLIDDISKLKSGLST